MGEQKLELGRNANEVEDTQMPSSETGETLEKRKFKKVKVLDNQSCPTLWDPIGCSLPGSSVHGILQARILEWVAIPLSRGSSQPRDRTWVS